MRLARKVTLFAVITAAMLASTGCYIFYNKDTVYPAFPTNYKRMVIIPFAFLQGDIDFDDVRGRRIASQLGQVLSQCSTFTIRDYDSTKLRKYFRKLGVLDEPDLEEIARLAKADYVLVGWVKLFTPKRKKDYGFFRGLSEIELKLLDVTGGGKILLDPSPVKKNLPLAFITFIS